MLWCAPGVSQCGPVLRPAPSASDWQWLARTGPVRRSDDKLCTDHKIKIIAGFLRDIGVTTWRIKLAVSSGGYYDSQLVPWVRSAQQDWRDGCDGAGDAAQDAGLLVRQIWDGIVRSVKQTLTRRQSGLVRLRQCNTGHYLLWVICWDVTEQAENNSSPPGPGLYPSKLSSESSHSGSSPYFSPSMQSAYGQQGNKSYRVIRVNISDTDIEIIKLSLKLPSLTFTQTSQ